MESKNSDIKKVTSNASDGGASILAFIDEMEESDPFLEGNKGQSPDEVFTSKADQQPTVLVCCTIQ